MSFRIPGFAVAAAAVLMPMVASAATMTFDAIPQGFFTGPYSENGLVFSQDAGFMFGSSSGGNPGGHFDAPNFQGAVQTFAMADSSSFNLISIDLAIWAGTNPQDQVFVGTLAGGGTVTATMNVPADFLWRTYQFDSSWTGLSSVSYVWNVTSQDNIVVSPSDIPEPASAALLGMFALGLAGLRRRT